MDADQIHKIEELVGRLPNDEERRERRTIYRVPAHIRESCKNYYEPRVVSIGPYHHGQPHLEATEKLKHRYLAKFLLQSGRSMKYYINALTPLEPEARRCYFEHVVSIKEEFVAMLLLDGCFIIELLRRSHDIRNGVISSDEEINNSVLPEWIKELVKTDLLMLENQIPYTVLNSLYDTYLSSSNVPQDAELPRCTSLYQLIISFFFEDCAMAQEPASGEKIDHLLHFYHQSFVPHIEDSKELEVVLPIEEPRIPIDQPHQQEPETPINQEGSTMVRLFRNLILELSLVSAILLLSIEVPRKTTHRPPLQEPRSPINQEESRMDKFIRTALSPPSSYIILSGSLILKFIFFNVMAKCIRFVLFGSFVHIDKTTPGRMIRCATQLKDSGVSIRQKREPASFLDVSFKYRYLKIPRTVIDKATRSNYVNLVAFEQSSDRVSKDLTGYAVFMNSLISNAKDVVILQREGIIENKLPDDEQLVLFFNDLRTCAYNYDSKYFKALFEVMSKFCGTPYPTSRANFFHNFNNNRLTIISAIIAIILLFAGIFQLYISSSNHFVRHQSG